MVVHMGQTFVHVIKKSNAWRAGLPLLKVSRMLIKLHREGVLDSPPSCSAIRSNEMMKYSSSKASGFNRYAD